MILTNSHKGHVMLSDKYHFIETIASFDGKEPFIISFKIRRRVVESHEKQIDGHWLYYQ